MVEMGEVLQPRQRKQSETTREGGPPLPPTQPLPPGTTPTQALLIGSGEISPSRAITDRGRAGGGRGGGRDGGRVGEVLKSRSQLEAESRISAERAVAEQAISQQEAREAARRTQQALRGQQAIRGGGRRGEIFVPEVGGFVQADKRGQFLDVTATVRPPTPEERLRIERSTGEKLRDIKDIVVSQIRKPEDFPEVKREVGPTVEIFGVPPRPDVTKRRRFTPREILGVVKDATGKPEVVKREIGPQFEVFGVAPRPDVTQARRFTPGEILGFVGDITGRPEVIEREIGPTVEIFGVPPRPDVTQVRKFTPLEVAGGIISSLRKPEDFPEVKREVGPTVEIFGVPPRPDVKDLRKITLRDIKDITGISTVEEIRRLNIEAK